MNKNKELPDFFNSYELELKSKMERLDNLIGKNHWLSVGNYKEKIIKDLLSNSLPKRFSVSTGFILSYDKEGNKIISKQQDIIIWDSNKYSAIFQNDDFVIISPEACSAVIEVKSNLTKNKLYEALESNDSIYPFLKTPYLQITNIPKFIFAYTSNKSFNSIYKNIEEFYKKNEKFSLKERLKLMHERRIKNHEIFFTDGIFILNKGAFIPQYKISNESTKIELNIYETKNHLYSFFEYKIKTKIDSLNNIPGLHYVDNPTYSNFLKHFDIKKIHTFAIKE